MRAVRRFALATALVWMSCAGPRVPASEPPPPAEVWFQETRFKNIRQLTYGGENAEAYWSFDGRWLSLQARGPNQGCDRIYRLPIDVPKAALLPISSGKGATTCAHYFPDGNDVLYASTHLGSDACPPKPDMSHGYVWALYDSYDIFKAKPDGADLRRLTDAPGYDAEGTVCRKDGSIVFTSTRDGDIELYRMDADGKNVKRLTNTPGYDGGAFFNADCSKIVWRASRPKPGPELDEFRALLKKGLVRPTKLELYVANTDGSEARQVTYLNAASFAPFWVPGEDRIIFSSNWAAPKGRDFDLWAINADGTELERVTYAQGFDGFPMFSPDGRWLAFSSNRATAPGHSDTNVFVSEWVKGKGKPYGVAGPDRLKADVQWLAAPEREGRGIGTSGLSAAGAFIEERFQALGLEPDGDRGSYREGFAVATGVSMEASSALTVAGRAAPAGSFRAMGFSSQGAVKGELVFAGYGIVDPELGVDDYKGIDAKGKIAVVRRFAPELAALDTAEKQRRAGDLRRKAFAARERGAVALVVVDLPAEPTPRPSDWQLPPEAVLPTLAPEGTGGDAGIPVMVAKRDALDGIRWGAPKVKAELAVALRVEKAESFNVVGRLKAPAASSLPPLVIGAHYDHLGLGGHGSLTPDRREPHVGADDNASGTAALLEIARILSSKKAGLKRDVVFASFTGEEEGALGSAHLVAHRPDLTAPGAAMLNLDMVGRLRGNELTVLGTETADEWSSLLARACERARVQCTGSGDGYGPSDQMSFYAAGVPVMFFFTGAHGDYHKPSDTPDKLVYGGAAQIAELVESLVEQLQDARLTFRKVAAPAPKGDARSYGASLGTVPNYGGPPAGIKGVLLDDVRPGGGAEKGGMRRGDVITRLGSHAVGSVEDLMFVLQGARPGETVSAAVLREGKEVVLEVTFQEGRRR